MKFKGKLGVIGDYEEEIVDGIPTGVYKSKIIEIMIYGDILQVSQQYTSSDKINKDVTLNNRYSFVASSDILYLMSSLTPKASIYLDLNGVKWSVTDIRINTPRITLDIGGIFNEEKGSTSESSV